MPLLQLSHLPGLAGPMGFPTSPMPNGRFAVLLLVGVLAGCTGGGEIASQLATKQKLAATTDQKNNIASLSEVIKTNPNDANALNLRGAAYGASGEYDRALADFNAAIQTNPQYYQAYANRALVYTRMNRLPQALDDYNRALDIDPKYGVAYIGRGNIYRAQNNHSAAIEDFGRALEIQGEPVAYFNRGLSRQALGMHGEALDDFENALGFRPDAPEVFHAKGLSELALNKYEKAFDDFYKAAQKEGNYEAWALRGRAAEGMGAKKEASRAYKRALQINPSYRPAREGLDRVGSNDA
jgi:tetratricopeptide (TPR) repeat protein